MIQKNEEAQEIIKRVEEEEAKALEQTADRPVIIFLID